MEATSFACVNTSYRGKHSMGQGRITLLSGAKGTNPRAVLPYFCCRRDIVQLVRPHTTTQRHRERSERRTTNLPKYDPNAHHVGGMGKLEYLEVQSTQKSNRATLLPKGWGLVGASAAYSMECYPDRDRGGRPEQHTPYIEGRRRACHPSGFSPE